MVNTCAGNDPLCTEQVNKIYVYFFKPFSLESFHCALHVMWQMGGWLFAAALASPLVFLEHRTVIFFSFFFFFKESSSFDSCLHPGERKQLMNFNEVLRKERQLTHRQEQEKFSRAALRVSMWRVCPALCICFSIHNAVELKCWFIFRWNSSPHKDAIGMLKLRFKHFDKC